LEDEGLIEPVEEPCGAGGRRGRRRGRPGIPTAVVLRLLVLKHLYAWAFADCEVRGSLIYRAFCGLECRAASSGSSGREETLSSADGDDADGAARGEASVASAKRGRRN